MIISDRHEQLLATIHTQTSAMTKTGSKQKPKDRGFQSYFPKMCKKQAAGARSEVHRELEKMLYFALDVVIKNGHTVLEYTKDDTVKPKIIQAALSTLLHGELKTNAIGAGVAAEVARVKKAAKVKGEAEEVA